MFYTGREITELNNLLNTLRDHYIKVVKLKLKELEDRDLDKTKPYRKNQNNLRFFNNLFELGKSFIDEYDKKVVRNQKENLTPVSYIFAYSIVDRLSVSNEKEKYNIEDEKILKLLTNDYNKASGKSIDIMEFYMAIKPFVKSEKS